MDIAVLVIDSILFGVILDRLIMHYRATMKLKVEAAKKALQDEFTYAHHRIDTARHDLRAELSDVHQNLHRRLVEVEDFFMHKHPASNANTAGPATGGQAAQSAKAAAGKKA
jgi:hypothetical protein